MRGDLKLGRASRFFLPAVYGFVLVACSPSHSFAAESVAAESGVASGNGVAAESGPPNIIFMMSDDHTSQAWHCYGGRLAEFVNTPNIDRIAREGALLRNCFCTNSICVPSRAAILTGQYSHKNGVRTLDDPLDPNLDNVAKRLRTAGYQTALVGKWHLKKEPSGFDYWNIIKGQGRYENPKMYEMSFDNKTVCRGYSTDLFTDRALEWLNGRKQDKPFCLMLHFKATHEPWKYHKRYADLYADRDLPLPEDLLGKTGPEGSRIPGWPLEILTERFLTNSKYYGAGKLKFDNDPNVLRQKTYQKLVKDFLRCGAAIDDSIGRVLEYLDRHSLAENTIVIYTSDQGYFLGEHNYFDKRFMLEESMRMPFVVRYPKEIQAGKIQAGTDIDDVILNVDFAPTLMDYAGAKKSTAMQGSSIRENLSGSTPQDWRKDMYYRYFSNSPERPAHFGLRTDRYKLIKYDGLTGPESKDKWELYDLSIDPREQENIHDKASEKLLTTLKARLRTAQEFVGDSE